MKTSILARTEIIITPPKKSFSQKLFETLETFTNEHYLIKDRIHFKNEELDLKKLGSLGLFYNSEGELLGFSRLKKEIITLQNQKITVCTGGTYQNPQMDITFEVAKFDITQAMHHKLSHPEEELVYIAHVNTPERYAFFANLYSTHYPEEKIRIPKKVLKVIQILKEKNNWASNVSHPMIIHEPLPLLKLSKPFHLVKSPLTHYYLSINPHYYSGNSLLVYLPLTIANITLSMKKIMTPTNSSNPLNAFAPKL